SDILTLSKTEDVLQMYHHLMKYHDDMEFGSADPFDITTDEYRNIYDKYSDHLINYVKNYGYYDMFLICASHGHVMFTTAKESDLGTNLGYGPFKDEALARLWREVVRTERVVIEDFSAYAPANGQQAAFIAAPVYDRSDKLAGMIALQIPTAPLNTIVQRRLGMGETGETYLVGKIRCHDKLSQ
ncbi:cache domain-containing protein, partial [Desulfobacterales bacterium HSG2]|nr:cache domain-containing protein [Desulfobacterales bacterium HSG2]